MVTKEDFNKMNLHDRWDFLQVEKEWPNRSLLLRNIKAEIKRNLWLKREGMENDLEK